MARYLLVVHELEDSPELVQAARVLAEADPSAEFILLVPATAPAFDLLLYPSIPPTRFARQRAQHVRDQLLAAGINLIATRLGNLDPVRSVEDATRFTNYSAVVVAAPPHKLLHLLHSDLACRLARRFRPTPVIHATSDGSLPVQEMIQESVPRSVQQ